jgi:hypothetical protein
MTDYVINYVLIGDIENKSNVFNWCAKESEIIEMTTSAMTIFDNASKININEVKIIPIESGYSYYTVRNKVLYLISTSKEMPEEVSKKLLDDLISENFNIKSKSISSEEDRLQFQKIVDSLKNSFSTNIDTNRSNIQVETNRLYSQQKLVMHSEPLHEKNNNLEEHINVNQEQEQRSSNAFPNPESSNDEVIDESIGRSVCRNNLKLILIFSFVAVGIILAVILPIVLSK